MGILERNMMKPFYSGEESVRRYTCMHHRHLKTSILRVVQIWETQNLSTSVAGRVFLQTWRILLLFVVFFPKRGSASPQKKNDTRGPKGILPTAGHLYPEINYNVDACPDQTMLFFSINFGVLECCAGFYIKQHGELTSK